MNINVSNTALLVIDMQADFYAPNGAAAKKGRLVSKMAEAANKIDVFASSLSEKGVLVIFTKYLSGEDVTPTNLANVAKRVGYELLCEKGSEGADFYGLRVPKSALVIEKPHYDAFAYTNLNEILKDKHIENVLVCGVRTEVCVDATAKRAASEGYETAILQDLTATYDDKDPLHNSILNFFDKYYGNIIDSSNVLAKLNL